MRAKALGAGLLPALVSAVLLWRAAAQGQSSPPCRSAPKVDPFVKIPLANWINHSQVA